MSLRWILAFCAIFAVISLVLADLPSITGSASTKYLYDDSKRVRIFHGVNFVTKYWPWYEPMLLNETYVEEIASLGVNVIRLGLMWTGCEPVELQYNATYYTIIRETVTLLAKHGIFTLLDMHQDALSTKYCLYDGIPLWLANKSISLTDFPWPFKGTCGSRNWGTNELTQACAQCYQDIYKNAHGMMDSFVNFWAHSAQQLGDLPLLGYELINEPFAGDFYTDPLLMLPGNAGRKNLMPMYDVVAAAIRAFDGKHLVFYEPVTWGMVFNNEVAGTGFESVPGGKQYAASSVLSFHYYCWIMGTTFFEHGACDAAFGPQVFDAIDEDLSRIGGSAMLTEFGADTCHPQKGNNTECQAVMSLCDDHFTSWIHWEADGDNPLVDRQMLSTKWHDAPTFLAQGFSRPYARAIAGTPISMSFQFASPRLTFQLCYQLTVSAVALEQTTEIYVNFAYYYPLGANVQTNSRVVAEVNVAGKSVLLTPVQDAQMGEVACVTIGKKT
eukprot:TRINITY_DN564_c0_g1_i1.p1 TRINITY_DN564_c0_g1~~TRINITY_DN564_c0_g1_i1.p1  ORF type:complete len:499 (-),score=61.65 TRINITY_DN564_c0_g1_i1:98-1594(-)